MSCIDKVKIWFKAVCKSKCCSDTVIDQREIHIHVDQSNGVETCDVILQPDHGIRVREQENHLSGTSTDDGHDIKFSTFP